MSKNTDRLSAALADRYRIVEHLGEGAEYLRERLRRGIGNAVMLGAKEKYDDRRALAGIDRPAAVEPAAKDDPVVAAEVEIEDLLEVLAAFGDLGRLHKQMYEERVTALKAFHDEVVANNFPYPQTNITMHPNEKEKFLEALDKT